MRIDPGNLNRNRQAPSRAARTGWLGAFRLLAATSVLVTLLGVAGTAAVASAATRSSSSAQSLQVKLAELNALPNRAIASTSTFCKDASNSEKSSTAPTPTDTAKYLANAYKQLKADESLVIGITPSQLKPDWETIFAYTSKIYAALAAVNYNYAKVNPKTFTTLLEGSKSVVSASEAIAAYLKKYCGISA